MLFRSILKDVDNNFKLIIGIGQYGSGFDYNVYSLPGTYMEINTLAENNKFVIYPNPTNNIINITNPKNGTNVLNMFSSNGQLVKSMNFGNGENITMNVNDLSKGVYIIKIGNLSSKFIKD